MSAEDQFEGVQRNLDSPAFHAKAVTPDDGTDLAVESLIYIGGAGDLKVTTKGGDTVTFVGLAAGTVLPVYVARVFDTDTTATDLVALY